MIAEADSKSVRVTITDEKLGGGLIRKGFPQLLNDPRASRMPRDVKVRDASAVMAITKKQ